MVLSFCIFSISEGLGLDGPVPCWDLQCKAGIERRWRQETLEGVRLKIDLVAVFLHPTSLYPQEALSVA